MCKPSPEALKLGIDPCRDWLRQLNERRKSLKPAAGASSSPAAGATSAGGASGSSPAAGGAARRLPLWAWAAIGVGLYWMIARGDHGA